MRVLSVDPGREKCGLAVVDGADEIAAHGVVPTAELETIFVDWLERWRPEKVLVGDGTNSAAIRKKIAPLLDKIPLVLVNERNSTYLSRKLYFQHNPPRGIWRFVPLGLQVPPVPYDDFAAAFMAIRHLAERHED